MKYSTITAQHDRIAIVASGPSAKGFAAPEGVTVIAVNGVIEWIDRADYWFTLDPSQANRGRMLNQREGVHYVAAVPGEFGTQRADTAEMRKPVPPGITYLRRMAGNGVLRSMPGLSEKPDRIHTGNSAYGALGLAYLLAAKRIALFGVDGNPEPRIEGGKPNSLAHLPGLFATAVPQLEQDGVEVVNASPASAVGCFSMMTMSEATEWLCS